MVINPVLGKYPLAAEQHHAGTITADPELSAIGLAINHEGRGLRRHRVRREG